MATPGSAFLTSLLVTYRRTLLGIFAITPLLAVLYLHQYQDPARAQRHGSPLSLVLIDLDYFKAINDRHGHPVGDEVLKAFVEQAGKLLRPEDMLGRMGGEEFAILLPQTDQVDALKVAERLRATIASQPLVIEGASIDLRLSGGVANYRQDYRDVDDWLRMVDRLLYEAKAGGRNRVV